MKKVLMFYGLLVIVVIIFMLTRGTNFLNFGGGGSSNTTATVGNKIYKLIVVKTEIDKQKGLSGKNSLPNDSGMLFPFQEKSKPAFWMKNMKFSIDILFINDSKIVDIVENAKNPSAEQNTNELPIYKPSEDANYVLEINAGEVEKNKIKKGDTVIFKGAQ